MNRHDAPTPKQLEYVADLCAKLKITTPALDTYCRSEFGQSFEQLSKSECSRLLDSMTTWETTPAELRRAMGQLDLFGVAS